MKHTNKTLRRKSLFRFAISLSAAAVILSAMVSLPLDTGKAAPAASGGPAPPAPRPPRRAAPPSSRHHGFTKAHCMTSIA